MPLPCLKKLVIFSTLARPGEESPNYLTWRLRPSIIRNKLSFPTVLLCCPSTEVFFIDDPTPSCLLGPYNFADVVLSSWNIVSLQLVFILQNDRMIGWRYYSFWNPLLITQALNDSLLLWIPLALIIFSSFWAYSLYCYILLLINSMFLPWIS